MKLFPLLCCLLLFNVILSENKTETAIPNDEIYELNDSNFDIVLQNGNNYRWFVLFYVSTCGHCRRAKKEIKSVFEISIIVRLDLRSKDGAFCVLSDDKFLRLQFVERCDGECANERCKATAEFVGDVGEEVCAERYFPNKHGCHDGNPVVRKLGKCGERRI